MFFNKVNPVKVSLTTHVWLPRNYLKFTSAMLAGVFRKEQAVNKKINFMKLKFWRHGHIALSVNNGKHEHYISWYPMHDLKRPATGYFVSPKRDYLIWGAPNVSLHAQVTEQAIRDAFEPLFMHHKKTTGPVINLSKMSLDELRTNVENPQLFSNNVMSIFSLYRPFSHLYSSSIDAAEQRKIFLAHVQDFNFSKLAIPYEAGHELSLFLMHRAGLPVKQIPGCYDGSVDLKQLSQLLEKCCDSMEITKPIATPFI